MAERLCRAGRGHRWPSATRLLPTDIRCGAVRVVGYVRSGDHRRCAERATRDRGRPHRRGLPRGVRRPEPDHRDLPWHRRPRRGPRRLLACRPRGARRAASATLAALDRATPADDIDRVTIAAMQEGSALPRRRTVPASTRWRSTSSRAPLQEVRGTFDLMPTATSEDWGVIARRMAKVPAAIDSWMKSLHSAADKGNVAPRRQVEACMKQCVDLTADDGYFAGLLAGAKAGDADLTDAVRSDLEKSVAAAADAYRALGDRLRARSSTRPEADACGRERYQLLSPRVPRGDGRPRGDLPLGPGGARPHHRRDGGGRRADQARRHRQGGHRRARRRPGIPGTHGRAQGVDADQGRRGDRQARRHPLRHPRPGAHHRVPHRADPDRWHLLHRPQRGLLAPGPHVVVRAEGRHRVRHLARG